VNENNNNNAVSNMAFPVADLTNQDADPREAADTSKVAG
jgi:hypothetical protein